MKKIIVISLVIIILTGFIFGVWLLLGSNQAEYSINLPLEDKNYIRYIVSKGTITEEMVIDAFVKGTEECIETINIDKDSEILVKVGSKIKKNELLYRNKQIEYHSKYEGFVILIDSEKIQMLNFEKTYIGAQIPYSSLEKIIHCKKILVKSNDSEFIGKMFFCGDQLDENQNLFIGFSYTGDFLVNTPIKVYILGNTKNDVFIVHQDALIYDNSKYYVQIENEDSTLSKIEINVGFRDAEGYVEIESVQLYDNMKVLNEFKI